MSSGSVEDFSAVPYGSLRVYCFRRLFFKYA